MIIDKNFKGLINKNEYYEYVGNIYSDENIEIKIPLYVTGSINAGKWIKADEWIESGEWIKADEWIKSGGSINAGEWINAGGSIEADESIESGGSIEASKWIKAGGSIEADGSIEAGKLIEAGEWIKAGKLIEAKLYIMARVKTKMIFFIVGKKYHITVLDTHIKIGCIFYTKEEWKNFTDDEIDKMDDGALDWWNGNKKLILSL